MKLKIHLIIFIVITGVFVFFLLKEGVLFLKNRDEIGYLLGVMKRETSIKFSEIQHIELKWIISTDPESKELVLEGEGFEAKSISYEQCISIESFFKKNDFEEDLNNIKAGTVSWLTGYKKDKIVCTLSVGAAGYKEVENPWIPPTTDKKDAEVKCAELEKNQLDYETEDWNVYKNEKYGYSLKYPSDCIFGPLPGFCKQKPPEERPRECLCFLNGQDPDRVVLQKFIGPKDNLTLSTITFSHYSTEFYNLPSSTGLIDWLKGNFSYQDIPDEINMQIDGIPAVGVYTPQSQGIYSQADIYFIKQDNLFGISMLDIDNNDNKKLYNQILFTFHFLEE
jgi:hypothetical protein